jgi:hypothetical protein
MMTHLPNSFREWLKDPGAKTIGRNGKNKYRHGFLRRLDPPQMKESPGRSSTVLHGLPQEQEERGKPSIKTYPARFDTLVARYYPAVYRFASRLTDDPRQAVLLTRRAFTSIRNQVWIPRDEIALVRILLKAVVRAGLTTLEPS